MPNYRSAGTQKEFSHETSQQSKRDAPENLPTHFGTTGGGRDRKKRKSNGPTGTGDDHCDAFHQPLPRKKHWTEEFPKPRPASNPVYDYAANGWQRGSNADGGGQFTTAAASASGFGGSGYGLSHQSSAYHPQLSTPSFGSGYSNSYASSYNNSYGYTQSQYQNPYTPAVAVQACQRSQ